MHWKLLGVWTYLARDFWWSLSSGGGGGGGAKVPTAYNSETIYGIKMKFGRVVENHKLINLV